MLALLTQYKTYAAGIGLIGLAVYQLSQGEYQAGIAAILGGLTAVGIRHETAPRLVPSNVQFGPRPGVAPDTYEQYNK